MNDFWTNILRYPRFFVSAFMGLFLVILAPFRNFFKQKKFRVPFLFGFFFFVFTVYFIVRTMTAS